MHCKFLTFLSFSLVPGYLLFCMSFFRLFEDYLMHAYWRILDTLMPGRFVPWFVICCGFSDLFRAFFGKHWICWWHLKAHGMSNMGLEDPKVSPKCPRPGMVKPMKSVGGQGDQVSGNSPLTRRWPNTRPRGPYARPRTAPLTGKLVFWAIFGARVLSSHLPAVFDTSSSPFPELYHPHFISLDFLSNWIN